jgi:hypothetical protein
VNYVFEQGSIQETGPNQEGGADADQLSKLNLELNYSHGDEYDLDQ